MNEFDWEDYLLLAKKLLIESKDSDIQEAKLRSAISRAYYAAFIKAKNYLERKGYDLSIKALKKKYKNREYISVHKEVRKILNNGEKFEKEIAKTLKDLGKARNDADYESEESNLYKLGQDTKIHIEQSKFILFTLAQN